MQSRRRSRLAAACLVAPLIAGVLAAPAAPVAAASPGAVAAGTVLEVPVAGAGVVPADAIAVALNVTTTDADADGFLTVFPCGSPRPTASNLNHPAGRAVANLVVSRIGDGGRVCVYAHATTDVIVDVAGWFAGGLGAATGVLPLPTPVRLVDTRAGFGIVEATSTLLFGVGGLLGLPSGAGAAVLNVTAAEPVTDGYLTVWPCDEERPTASNLNFSAGATVANLVLTRVGADGRVCAYAHGTTHVVVDAAGWLPAGTGFAPVTGAPRLLDTRGTTGRFLSGQARVLTVDATPASGTPRTTVLNVTVTEPLIDGFVTVWPCDQPQPLASNLNYRAGDTVANLVVSRVADDGTVCVYAHGATHVVVDEVGTFGGMAFVASTVPARLVDTRRPSEPVGTSG